METAGNMSAQAAQTSVSPELSVRRGRQAIEFYKAAFGALEIYRWSHGHLHARTRLDGMG
jgi:uncharacterized glyoxalase superfamily protein PhnB